MYTITWQLESLADVYRFAQWLCENSGRQGVDRAHARLAEYFSQYWTTSFEALGELRSTLLKVETDVGQAFPPDVKQALWVAVGIIDQSLGNKHRS